MKKLILAALVILGSSFTVSKDVKISDVNLKGVYYIDGQSLVLNGGGLREKYFINLFVAGLYLKSKTKDAPSIINSKDHQALFIHVVSSLVTADKFKESLEEGFKMVTKNKTSSIRGQINRLKLAFAKDFKIGDKIIVANVPGKGVVGYYNQKKVFEENSYRFKKILWKMWLGKNPVDSELKTGLLGS